MSRSRSRALHKLSPLAQSVARAAASSDPGNAGGSDLHAAVTELAHFARAAVITNGVLASEDLRAVVDRVACRHLKRAAADRRLTRTLKKVGDRQLRNAIEVAHDQVLEPSEIAHYYAGLMAGLALLELGRGNR